jgi:hypothetical protein
MPATHVYSHPEGLGLGQHHAGDADLSARPAQPPEAAAGLRAALEAMDPTPEQRAKMEAMLGQTMADLDMHDGTEVEYTGDDEAGNHIVAWTDSAGTPRNTSLTPQLFAQFFREVQP